MDQFPTVSVVIPTYNAAPYLAAAVESVIYQTYPIHEIIIVDDGSTDGTQAVVEQLAAKHGEKIRYVYQQNARQAAARNNGVRHACGELIAFLDSDDVWLPQKLERQVAELRKGPAIGLVYCSVRYVDATCNPVRDAIAWVPQDPLQSLLLGDWYAGANGSTPLIPRRVFEEIGAYDESLPPCEDTDLFWRIAAQYQFACATEVLVLYRLHSAQSHKNLVAMTRAWKGLYTKALQHPAVIELGTTFRRRAYGRLYFMLAGDHAAAGQIWKAAGYAVTCLWWWPPAAGKVLQRLGRTLARCRS